LTVTLSKKRGALLREARKTLGKTQLEMARAMDVHETTVSLWESGQRPLPAYRLDSVYRIVEFLRPDEKGLLQRIEAVR
jgi:transcriptional regulator with XRE-family HTH domain